MAQKVTSWLLIILVLSLGFGQLLRFEILGIPLYLHDLVVVLLLTLNLKLCRPPVLPFSLKLFFTGLALGWLRAFTLFPLSSLLVPSLYTLRLVAYLTLYLVLKSTKVVLPKTYFFLAGLVSLSIGYLQYFLLPDMRLFQSLGWDDHWNRLTLPHFDPTFTGVMLGLFALTLVPKHWHIGILAYLGIIFTYSRSIWLSLALTALIFIKNKKILLISGILLLASICVLPRQSGEGTNLLRTYSISSRLDSDISYIQKYQWDLLVGRGLNTLILDSPASLYPDHATGPNNSYLFLLTTCGILGLLGFLLFLRDLYLPSLYKPLFVFVLLASLFNNVLFYPFVLLWLLLTNSTVPSAT